MRRVFCVILAVTALILVSCADNKYTDGYGVDSIHVNVPLVNVVRQETTAAEETTTLDLNHAEDEFIEELITVNHSEYAVSDYQYEQLLSILENYKFDVGFYAIDLVTQMSIGYNADQKFTTASTVKAGYALYCFKEIMAGNAELSDCMTYRQKHFISGSGSTQNSVYGTIFTIKVLLYRLLYNSDNVAYYMLLDFFGYDAYNEMMKELGCEHELSSKNKWGEYSAHELGLIWKEIYKFKDTCEEGEMLWEYLTGNLYNEIKEELPQYETVAHKSGWGTDGYHEAGIIYHDKPYIVVVMTGTGYKNSCLYELIAYIDGLMIDYNKWSENTNNSNNSEVN